MKFEILHTERLCIRRFRPTDADTMALYRSLPEVVRFQSSYTRYKAEEIIRQMSESDPGTKGEWFQFAVELVSENQLIGDIGFLNTDGNGKSWVGFTLHPSYWHFGYASEAVTAVLRYYQQLGVSSVWASTDPENESSMKLLRTLGFVLVEAKPDDMVFEFRRNTEQ